jgi:hypothetical protein
MNGTGRRIALALFFSLAAGGIGGAAPPASAAEAPELAVEAPPSLAGWERRIEELDPERFERVVELVGLEDPGPPIRVIVAGEGSPEAASAPPWVNGYALSERGVVVLLVERSPDYPYGSFEGLLLHELAHVLIARAGGNRRLPRWFHEGLAMLAGRDWGFDDRSRVTLALAGRGDFSLAGLERAFAGGPGTVQQSYAVAGAFVRELFRRHGEDVAAEVLDGVAAGLPFEEAFRRATGATLAEAEEAFRSRRNLWYRWVPALTSSFALWIFVTLLAFWALRRRRERTAALQARWEAEERAAREPAAGEPPPGGWVN